MDPITLSAIIGGGSTLVNAASSLFTNSANKKNALEFYNRQRTDALADWNMQNLYNSPKAQMQRYKEAGLSPHLIYGQQTTSPSVRSASADTPKYVAPQMDNNLMQIPLMKIQMDNLRKQGALLDAQTVKTNSDTEWRNLNTDFLNQTMPYRSELLFQQGQLTGKKVATEQEKTKVEYGKLDLQIKQGRKLVADTNLSVEKKAQASQIITNLITTERLLGKKIVTEDFIQQVYYGRSGLLTEQKHKTSSDAHIARELLELKQIGVPLDVVKGALLMRQPTTINKTFNRY